MSGTAQPPRIWSEQLTPSERALIVRVFDGSTGFVEARKWLAHVVRICDAQAELIGRLTEERDSAQRVADGYASALADRGLL